MFIRRLFIYLIGFFLGCAFVYFLFFKGKNRSFFPSAIVLDSLTSKELLIEKKAACSLACYHVSNQNLKELLADGDVIFSESRPRETPKKYAVKIETPEGNEITLLLELSALNATIISVLAPAQPACICN